MTDSERLEILRAAVQHVLDDEESGEGWGPDVTMVAVLQEAMEVTDPEADAPGARALRLVREARAAKSATTSS